MAPPPPPALRRLRHLQSALACNDPAPPLNLRQQPAAGGRYRVADVNTTDIIDAIALACSGAMSNVFNADDNDIPFFSSNVRGEGGPLLAFSSAHSESHVPGRHLNAMLNAESAAGVSLDETAVTKHAAVGLAEWIALTYGDDGIKVSVLCPQAVRTNMTKGKEDHVASVDGMMDPEPVAQACLEAIEQETFLVLPHKEVLQYMRNKTENYDRWIGGMRKLNRKYR